MKWYSIIWRVIWVLFAITTVVTVLKGEGTISMAIFFSCVIVNIPIYLYRRFYRDEAGVISDALDWEFHPIRTIILGLLFAPLLTVAMIIQLTIEAIKLLFE